MATEKKITKRDRFNELLGIPAVAENEGLVEFIEHEIELLDKKNTAGQINFPLLHDVGDLALNQTATTEEIDESLDFYREGC